MANQVLDVANADHPRSLQNRFSNIIVNVTDVTLRKRLIFDSERYAALR